VPQTVIVSFKAPAELVERLDDLVRMGLFRNRSEALRHALVLLVSKYRGEVDAFKASEGRPSSTIKASRNDFIVEY
jgi:Arc/MetJ-type ribon-helix-helix transcriptional regulator